MITLFSQYVSARSIAVMLFETFLIAFAVVGGAWLRLWNDIPGLLKFIGTPAFVVQAILMTASFQICFHYGRLYEFRRSTKRADRLAAILRSVGTGCLLLGVLSFLFPALLALDGVVLIGIVLALLTLAITRAIFERFWSAGPKQNVLIFGTGSLASTVAREIRRREDLNLNIVGFVSCEDDLSPVCRGDVIGKASDLERIAAEMHVSRIVLATGDQQHFTSCHGLVRLRVSGVKVDEAQSTMCALSGRVLLETVQPSWFVLSEGFHQSRFTRVGKRVFDIFAAFIGLIVFSPLMLLIAIAIRLDSKGPALFRQTRVGLGGTNFKLWKFRSMRTNAETGSGARWATKNDSRVTAIGKYLRKYRLDELPQLWNILCGEMSCVGPRPERPEFVEHLRAAIPYYDERHLIVPGLTGWAQVRYSYGSSVEDAMWKLEYDLFYLKNLSLMLDAAIMARTIRIVLTGKGAR